MVHLLRFKRPLKLKATYCLFTGQVEMPKIVYNGQKLIMLVKVNTPDSTRRIIPNVPLTTFVK